MLTASLLLLLIGALGAFDVVWFHDKHARLVERAECRREAWVHVARGPVYALQFALLPNVRFHGAWFLALVLLFVVDAAVAALDVLIEPSSRRAQGGLPAGEYFMHVLLSVLVGAMIHASLAAGWTDRTLPTALAYQSDVPGVLRVILGAFAVGVSLASVRDALALIVARLPRPKPIHVAVVLPTTVEKCWDLTQDHVIHPTWDHRFDTITMLTDDDGVIRTGTSMLYEKTILGITIRGTGRYKLHRSMCQSTFEFGTDDRRSLIRKGVGLWRYRRTSDGQVELSTSYTYEVRWGLFGRLFDRMVFRPLFQRETEKSFERLARRYFGVARPRVRGANGRKPEREVVPTPIMVEPAAS